VPREIFPDAPTYNKVKGEDRMGARKELGIVATLALAVVAAGRLAGQQLATPAEHQHAHSPDMAMEAGKQTEQGAVQAMTPGHHHMGPHIRMTAPRPQTPEDLARADALVRAFRTALEKYKDYRVAIADGYQPFLPQLPQRQYHFTNYWHGFLEAFTFDPARPTSLLYKKTPEGYELVGAMYTMPKNATEEQLNERVPLSVARWHAHVNLCRPPKGQAARADWTKFGLAGSISTPQACAENGGRFTPQIFGWMVHVYPFESSPENLWGQ
jgi:hypothetical protein